MFMGFPGVGFTFNFGGNREGAPRASVNFMSFSICIAMVVLSMASEFFSVVTPRLELQAETAARRSGQKHRQPASRVPRRVRAAEASEDWGQASYLFSGVYTVCVVAFVAYAVLQRNRNARPV